MAEGGGKPPDMGDLLEYFEAQSRNLDQEGQPYLDASTLQFISLIKFGGVPILPPVLSPGRREEMQTYRKEALRKASCARARTREELHAKVQSIVAGVETAYSLKCRPELPRTDGMFKLLERRAAKQAVEKGPSRSPSSRQATTSEILKLSSKSVFTDTSKSIPAEIVIDVTASQSSSAKTGASVSSSPSTKSASKVTSKKSSPSVSASSTPTKSGNKSYSNYKSLGKLGTLTKQKSFSSQHLDRASMKSENEQSVSSGKDLSLSPKSRALLPHPPDGRPPSRGSGLRQSASTPDLRTIDFSVQKEDLTKPIKVYGGRPQANADETDKSETSKLKEKIMKKAEELKAKSSKAKPDIPKKNPSLVKEAKGKKVDPGASDRKGGVKEKTKPAITKPKPEQAKLTQNPLEVLEQEITKEQESESLLRHGGSIPDQEVRREIDPIQAAAAQLFPYPISEEQALATLDSLQADFQSLEQNDSLPKEYNGIPLNSLKEQQIIHMLTKLSTALNIEDTLTSTTSSNASGEPVRDVKQDQSKGQGFRQPGTGDARSVPSGASGRGYVYSDPQDSVYVGDDSVNLTYDSNTTAPSSGSASSNHSRARMSPTGSLSILSSASSMSGSRQRMSPKSLKNNVHFSSMVTEISTSASQSYEDKISYRKLDITPKNSENFEEYEDETPSASKNLSSSGPSGGSRDPTNVNSLLHKVNLSPSVDSSTGSPGEVRGQDFPFEPGFQDGELNTSDKENEFVSQDTESSDENYPPVMTGRSRNQQVLNVYMANIPAGPIGANHPAVVKTSVKSDGSETSTLKESQEKLLSQENVAKYNLGMETQYYYGTSSTDLGKFVQSTNTTNSSTTSMQDEITKSYLLSEHSQNISKSSNDKCEVRASVQVERGDQSDLDESAIILKPIIYHNTQNSLQHNRSLLDEEAQIRSNLQRVEFDDTDDESGEDECENVNDKNEEVIEKVDKESDKSDDEIQVEEVPSHADEITEQAEDTSEDENNDLDEPQIVVMETDDTVEKPETENQATGEEKENEIQHDAVRESETGQAEHVDVEEEQFREEEEPMMEEEVEEKGKAEHIQKYLSQVHEQSLQQDNFEDVDDLESKPESIESGLNLADMIRSFASTIQSMNHLSQEELFKIQEEQFEQLQQRLIEQQRQQLEELFVAQRREQMRMQQEIEQFQQSLQSRESLETLALQENLRPTPSRSLPQVTQAWQAHQPAQQLPNMHQTTARSPPFPVQLVPTSSYYQNPNSSMMSCSTGYGIQSYPADPRMMMPGYGPPGMVNQDPNISHISHNTSYSTIPHLDPGMMGENIGPPRQQQPDPSMMPGSMGPPPSVPQQRLAPSMVAGNMGPPQQWMDPGIRMARDMDPSSVSQQQIDPNASNSSNPFSYPQSPSLYRDPKDRDNVSEASSFVKATPKQLFFSNQSTPVPKVYKPILHSPVKQVSSARHHSGIFHIPEKIFDPAMQPKFARVSAAVKGYLTRRLLRTQKVQDIIKTISDTRNFAFSFQAETPIKKGTFSREDRMLLERIVAQLQAALLDIHEIFFLLPVSERMGIIELSRQQEEDKKLKDTKSNRNSLSKSQPRVSQATLKAIERKKKAQLAESAVFGSTEFRPKSAPPTTSSPHCSTDISGPLRRHYGYLFTRALRPIQGQISPIHPDSQISVREIKERPKSSGDRPKSAQDKHKSGSGGTKARKSNKHHGDKDEEGQKAKKSGTKTSKSSSTTISSNKQKVTLSKAKKSEKAWR